MRRLWFITNMHSGSADAAKCVALEQVFREHGLELVGRTDFPGDRLPGPDALDRDGVDTAVLFAGDGTINAGVCALAEWDGAILILPGGTMNMLAHTLHGTADPAGIIHAAHVEERRVALPFAEAGPHRALVGLIIGPAAHWAKAREAARAWRVGAMLSAIRGAWRRTFGRGIRIANASELPHRLQAVFVKPTDGHLEVSGFDARDFRSITELGWNWLTGDWVAARAVTRVITSQLTVAERRPTLALFDGEEVLLPAFATVTTGLTKPQFIATEAG